MAIWYNVCPVRESIADTALYKCNMGKMFGKCKKLLPFRK